MVHLLCNSREAYMIKLSREEEKIFELIPEIIDDDILKYFKSDDGIIELLCNIPNFKFEEYYKNNDTYSIEERNKVQKILDLTSIIDKTLLFLSYKFSKNNVVTSLNSLQFVGLNLFYFGIKENGVYVGLEDPYLDISDFIKDTGIIDRIFSDYLRVKKENPNILIDDIIDLNIDDILKERIISNNITQEEYIDIIKDYFKYDRHIMINLSKLKNGKNLNKGNVPFNLLEIEHILNLANNSANILPNCILASAFANRGTGQKFDKLLLSYLSSKEKFDYSKLYSLADYILTGYQLLFEDYKETAGFKKQRKLIFMDKDDGLIFNNLKFIECILDELNIDFENSYLRKKMNIIGSKYYDDWSKLKKVNNFAVEWIRNNISNKDREIEYDISNCLQRFDFLKFYNAIDSKKNSSIEELSMKVIERFDLIYKYMTDDGKYNFSIVDYFESEYNLKILNLDLLYFTEEDIKNITHLDVENFRKSLKICKTNSIDLFLDVIGGESEFYTSYESRGVHKYLPDKNNVFMYSNNVFYGESQEIGGNLNLSYLWANNKDAIKQRLQEKLDDSIGTKEHEKYERAKQRIDKYEFCNFCDASKRIDMFIEMASKEYYTSYVRNQMNHLVPDDNNIFIREVPFEGYEDIKEYFNVAFIWSTHRDDVKKRVEELLEKTKGTLEHKKYERSQVAIDNYEFLNHGDATKRIDKFIDMISREDELYTSYTLSSNRNAYVTNNNNVFRERNTVAYDGYEETQVSNFWGSKKDEIKQRLKELLEITKGTEEYTKYERAQKAIDKFEFVNINDATKRIDLFIDMISREDKKYTSFDDNNVFVERNKVPFEGYEGLVEYVNTSSLWNKQSDSIIERLNELLDLTKGTEEYKKYERAQKEIEEYKFVKRCDATRRIDTFIDMISKEEYTSYVVNENVKKISPNKNNVFGAMNEIAFEGYEDIKEYINTKSFWSYNKDQIKMRINELKRICPVNEIDKYERAIKAIDKYEFLNYADASKRFEIFIDMLNRKDKRYVSFTYDEITKMESMDELNIFNSRIKSNPIPFDGYEDLGEYVNTSQFWSNNKSKIIALLFESDKYRFNEEYDIARENVMYYLNYCRKRKNKPEFNSYNEYLESLDKSKKDYKNIVEMRELMKKELEELLIENFDLQQQLFCTEVGKWMI